jgi:methanogenic corrinoid protein MtbC1
MDSVGVKMVNSKGEEDLITLNHLVNLIKDNKIDNEVASVWLQNYLTFLKIDIPAFYKSVGLNLAVPIKMVKLFPSILKHNSLPKAITDLHISIFSDIERQSSEEFRLNIEDDTEKNIQFLIEAIDNESVLLFTEYIIWANSLLVSLGMTSTTLIRFLITMRIVIAESELHKGCLYIDAAIKLLLDGNTISSSSSICFTQTPESKQYLAFLLDKKKSEAKKYILDLIENGMDIKQIYIDVFQASQYELGRLWELNEITVAQEHYATAVTNSIMSIVSTYFSSENKNGLKVITTCVGSEQHAMGIRVVNDFLEMDGWETYYMGANVPTKSVLSAIEEVEPDILALSVTLTPHIKQLRELITEVKNHFPRLKILVGGYPFLRDNSLWKKMSADGFASSSWNVSEIALEIIRGGK